MKKKIKKNTARLQISVRPLYKRYLYLIFEKKRTHTKTLKPKNTLWQHVVM